MKAYSFIVIFVCHTCRYTLVDIMPEVKRNILNFGDANYMHLTATAYHPSLNYYI